MPTTLRQIVAGRPTAVLGFPGQFDKYGPLLGRVPIGWIMNLTASTVGGSHVNKVQAYSVHHAIRLGCDAVAAHLNLTAADESRMLEQTGRIIEAASSEGIPTVAIIYPRRSHSDGTDDNYESLKIEDPAAYSDLVSRCVRLGSDLGATVVKTQYTGDPNTFRRVCDTSEQIPVVVAGGALRSEESALTMVRGIAASSAAGISFGRNVFNRPNIPEFLEAARTILESA